MTEDQELALKGMVSAIVTKLWVVMHNKGVPESLFPVYTAKYLADIQPSIAEDAWPLFSSTFEEKVEIAETFGQVNALFGGAQ